MGNLNIDKLHEILLIEADYSWLPKIPINKGLIPCAEETGLILDKSLVAEILLDNQHHSMLEAIMGSNLPTHITRGPGIFLRSPVL